MPNFSLKNSNDRFNLVKLKSLCMNCLSSTHKTHDCKSKFSCRQCKKHHYSLLHFESKKSEDRVFKSNVATVGEDIPERLVQATVAAQLASSVLLATAMICVRDTNGSLILLRVVKTISNRPAIKTIMVNS